MRIGLFIKEELNETDIATYIISKINEHGFDFDNDNPDFVIFVGGDGTFLRAVNEYLNQINDIFFIGINEGTLGFYSGFVIDELDEALEAIEQENYDVVSHHLIEGHVGGEVIYAVNEIRIENPFHTLISKVYVDDEYLETFRGNGLTICTTNGSSAYNKSLGGAVISYKLQTLQLTEIAPINNRVYRSLNSPIVISKEESFVLEGNFEGTVIGYDYSTTSIDGHRMVVRLSNKVVNLVERSGFKYVKKIHDAFVK